MTTTRIPAHWNEQADGTLVCPHRSLSVCPDCFDAYDEVVDVWGVAYWIADPADRAEIIGRNADRVCVTHDTGIVEYGRVVSEGHGRTTVAFDDGTQLSVPTRTCAAVVR